ncbi:MAG: alpha/beta hydrolase [Candidatus Zixiibacteriota bacterium]|nr:MAG: alpha/beta hydrolase [candidate division Zixibacteria bacterium]
MNESYQGLGEETIYLRHNEIRTDRLTLFFVHGLGSSGSCFEDVFAYPQFGESNIIIPDLIGYGRSSSASEKNGYGLNAHIRRLWRLIEGLQLSELVLIGHSMGADLTTFMCQEDIDGTIKRFVCIESDITQHETAFSKMAYEAVQRGEFEAWFARFRDKEGWDMLGASPSGREYWSALRLSRADAFRQDAVDLMARAHALPEPYRSEMGAVYCALEIPRVFCYGTESLRSQSLRFLKENGMEVLAFESAGHSPMMDQPEVFYPFLYDFVRR